jgi:hypothetical protein
MTQTHEQEIYSNNAWTDQWQQAYTSGIQNWGNLWRSLMFNDTYNNLWNQYVKGLIEFQQFFQRINQTLLQAYGLPTRSDQSRINRELYEIHNRLDDLEARLNTMSNTNPNL